MNATRRISGMNYVAAAMCGAVVALVLSASQPAAADYDWQPAIAPPPSATAGLTDGQIQLLGQLPALQGQLTQAYNNLVEAIERVNWMSLGHHRDRGHMEAALASLAQCRDQMAAAKQFVIGQLAGLPQPAPAANPPAIPADAANAVMLVPGGPPPAIPLPPSPLPGLTAAQLQLLAQNPGLLGQLNDAYDKLAAATDRVNSLSFGSRGNHRQLELANAALGESRDRVTAARQFVLQKLADLANASPPAAPTTRPDKLEQEKLQKLTDEVKAASTELKALHQTPASRMVSASGNAEFDMQELRAVRNLLKSTIADRQAGQATDAEVDRVAAMLRATLRRIAPGENP